MRWGLVAIVGALVPGTAWASNGVGIRTPPIYPRAACITDVDRSATPVFHLDIGLPREDFMVTDDEPPDSRRFQFFLVCEDVHVAVLDLPNWITAAEAQDALARGSIDQMPPDEDVLELRDDLRDCVFPMNGADARLPITCEATAAGLDFDTSDVPAGNYVVRGYTYEPPLNLWSSRRGVVRIYDEAEQAPASVGLRTPSLDGMQLRTGSPFPIQGCAASTCDVELQYVSLIDLGSDEESWQTFATLGAGSFEVLFDPGEDLVGQPLLVRAIAEPGSTSPWIDHAEGTLLVFGDGGNSDEPFGEPIEVCGHFDPAAEPASAVGGELTCEEISDDTPDEGDPGGCACGPQRRPTSPSGWMFIVLLVLLRRRHERR